MNDSLSWKGWKGKNSSDTRLSAPSLEHLLPGDRRVLYRHDLVSYTEQGILLISFHNKKIGERVRRRFNSGQDRSFFRVNGAALVTSANHSSTSTSIPFPKGKRGPTLQLHEFFPSRHLEDPSSCSVPRAPSGFNQATTHLKKSISWVSLTISHRQRLKNNSLTDKSNGLGDQTSMPIRPLNLWSLPHRVQTPSQVPVRPHCPVHFLTSWWYKKQQQQQQAKVTSTSAPIC